MEVEQQTIPCKRSAKPGDRDEALELGVRRAETSGTGDDPESLVNSNNKTLMEAVVERANLQRALSRVVNNGGAPGVDEMTVKQLPKFLKIRWLAIKEELMLAGGYN